MLRRDEENEINIFNAFLYEDQTPLLQEIVKVCLQTKRKHKRSKIKKKKKKATMKNWLKSQVSFKTVPEPTI